MTYTPSASKTAPIASSFGSLVRDRKNQPMPFGNYLQTQDATGTPVTSPVTVNTTSTLVVPATAYEITITPVTNPVQVSEDSTQSTFFTIPAGAVVSFPCSRQANIYLKTGGSTVVSFVFKLVN